MNSRSRAPRIGRIGLVIVSVITIVTAVTSINSPSASTAMVVHYDRVQTADIINTVSLPVKSNTVLPTSTAQNGADDTSGLSETKAVKPGDANQSPPVRRRPRVQLATLAPSLPTRLTSKTPEPRASAPAPSTMIKTAAIQAEADGFDILREPEAKPLVDPEPEVDAQNVAEDKDAGEIEILNVADDINKETTESPTSIASISASIQTVFHPIQQNQVVRDKPKEKEYEWHEVVVKKRDTLSRIFDRLGLDTDEAYAVADLKDARALNAIQPGQKIRIAKTVSADNPGQEQLGQLLLSLNIFDTLLIERQGDGYEVSEETREPEIEFRTASAEINSSLLGAAKQAGIPGELVYEMASIFGWKVDFAKNLHPGDSFSMIYEQLLLDDEVVGYGQIVAAELTAGGKKLRAIRHTDEHGRVAYYSPQGEGMEGSFLRSPMRIARVTSKFSKGRLHPIHKTWKAHKGVDYGAPMNTPIRATGDGVVKMVGRNGGYGNVVVLQHGRNIETLYAHMNKFRKGLRNGSRVSQGDIIGYVGRTGWATGPHLHYEFRTNGRHRDPLTVELPGSPPINDKYRQQFLAHANKWVNRLERQGRITLARNSQE